eukprot:CAMPEP_0119113098 /NCGR_PEP_ID=MMETSP1180-20130426/42812_1 /TAXON_ID=3052 ORGANISM="Chlamydomonas cf sp, Strain CCMP681" /NCGR_SAMPLE_ID=MMETSP1180 /ASSEMBLY_ACC=CAM_ASM_000741 /LENGTH=47 /DNA_ID= /DNA_START= /DNA_END= /DNA_ORIENTATION=
MSLFVLLHETIEGDFSTPSVALGWKSFIDGVPLLSQERQLGLNNADD